MKLLCSLLLLIIFTFFCYSQNKVSPKSSAAATNDAGQPKIINPEGKTPWPYSHAVDRGLQDKSGNIWFATSEGVYRYDGKLFTNYKVMGGVSVLSLTGMVEDKAGNMWFGTQGGAVRYDGNRFAGIEMPGNPLSFLTSTESRNTEGHFPTPKPDVAIFPDRDGVIWISSGFDLMRYDERSRSAAQTGLGYYMKSVVMPYDSIRRDAFIHNFYQDRKGNIWFSIWGCSTVLNETYRLDGSRVDHPCVLNKCTHDLHNSKDLATHNKEIAASVTRITKKDGTSIGYTSVFEDKQGNMWFGTWENGAYRYEGKFLAHFLDKDGLGSSTVGTIYEDRAGNIWLGTGNRSSDHGNGVFRYDPSKTGLTSVTHFTNKDGLCNTTAFKNNIITSITEDNTGNIWFGGSGGACRYNGKTFTNFTKKDDLNEQPVNCIMKDKAGNIWIGTWELGLYRYDGKAFTCFTESRPGL